MHIAAGGRRGPRFQHEISRLWQSVSIDVHMSSSTRAWSDICDVHCRVWLLKNAGSWTLDLGIHRVHGPHANNLQGRCVTHRELPKRESLFLFRASWFSCHFDLNRVCLVDPDHLIYSKLILHRFASIELLGTESVTVGNLDSKGQTRN